MSAKRKADGALNFPFCMHWFVGKISETICNNHKYFQQHRKTCSLIQKKILSRFPSSRTKFFMSFSFLNLHRSFAYVSSLLVSVCFLFILDLFPFYVRLA